MTPDSIDAVIDLTSHAAIFILSANTDLEKAKSDGRPAKATLLEFAFRRAENPNQLPRLPDQESPRP